LIPPTLQRTKRICQSHYSLLEKENRKTAKESKIERGKERPARLGFPFSHQKEISIITNSHRHIYFSSKLLRVLGKLLPLFIMVGAA
jgi:hypothetical protein